jgi:alanine dehydrogenase
MIIGVPAEIKSNENRVALTPGGALELKKRGHTVFIQKGAGIGSGFPDAEYVKAGAKILPSIESVYAKAEMIMKVKEPIAKEYPLCRKGQLIFTYFHFASSRELTDAMIKSGSICLAYETVETYDRQLPLLIPMSEVAGRMAIQEGAKYLERPMGGRGVLLGGVPGVPPGKVLVLGGGVVGTQAAKIAAGLGAMVTILDVSLTRLRYLSDVMPPNVITMYSSEYNIRQLIQTHDLVIGAVLIPGAKAPKLITKDMLKTMRPGTVIVDVAVDQGGCFETTKATTHDKPTFSVNEVIHYCVANMPGAVPYTSTVALTNATLPYAMQLAQKGWKKACRENRDLRLGLNVVDGDVVYAGVAQAFKLPLVPVEQILEMQAAVTIATTKTTSNGADAPKKAGRPAASAAPAPTGKRGRPAAGAKSDGAESPKKSAAAVKVAAKKGPKAQAAVENIAIGTPAPAKKSAGRPKGSENKAKVAKAKVEKVAVAKVKVAKVAKVKVANATPAKRGPKPKVTVMATDGIAPTPIKKSAGRPKGTENKVIVAKAKLEKVKVAKVVAAKAPKVKVEKVAKVKTATTTGAKRGPKPKAAVENTDATTPAVKKSAGRPKGSENKVKGFTPSKAAPKSTETVIPTNTTITIGTTTAPKAKIVIGSETLKTAEKVVKDTAPKMRPIKKANLAAPKKPAGRPKNDTKK